MILADPLGQRAIAATPDNLRRVPRVLAVAAGAVKAPAIASALSTGVIGMLVTDAAAARAITERAPAKGRAGPR